ncbi:MAG TPA: hypothetical protein VLM80_12775 [Anaerolineales bacterium]|nr:hypothetical protein [Anaerolineales bacterium]
MNIKLSTQNSSILPIAIPLMLLGWGSLAFLFLFTEPSGGTRWAMFFSGMLAVTGTTLPVVSFLNRRFPSLPPPSQAVIVRQAIWVGLYIPTLVWLQIGRVMNPSLALLLAVGFLLIEGLLRLIERSLWKPDRKV